MFSEIPLLAIENPPFIYIYIYHYLKWWMIFLYIKPCHILTCFFPDCHVAGSYSALTAGFQPVAWHHLTGCDEFFRYKSSYKVAVRWVVDTEGLPVYSDACCEFSCECVKKCWKGMERTSPKRLGYVGSMCVWLCMISTGTCECIWHQVIFYGFARLEALRSFQAHNDEELMVRWTICWD